MRANTEPHVLSGDNAYYDLEHIHRTLGENNTYFSFEAYLKEQKALVQAMHIADSEDYAFVATFSPVSDRWREVYSCTIYPDQELAKFAVMQALGDRLLSTCQSTRLWTEFQQDHGLVVPNSEDRLAFGAILRTYRGYF